MPWLCIYKIFYDAIIKLYETPDTVLYLVIPVIYIEYIIIIYYI